MVKEIAKVSWPASCQIKIVEVLKDLSLTPPQLRVSAAKAAKQLPEVALDELPGLVYQLLLLGNQRGGQERAPLLSAVLDHFIALDAHHVAAAPAEPPPPQAAPTAEALRAVEGNVIHLFRFAATQVRRDAGVIADSTQEPQ